MVEYLTIWPLFCSVNELGPKDPPMLRHVAPADYLCGRLGRDDPSLVRGCPRCDALRYEEAFGRTGERVEVDYWTRLNWTGLDWTGLAGW